MVDFKHNTLYSRLKRRWSDLSNLHLVIKPLGQTGVVDSNFRNTNLSIEYLPYFIQDKLRYSENKPVLKPNTINHPGQASSHYLDLLISIAWPPPAKRRGWLSFKRRGN